MRKAERVFWLVLVFISGVIIGAVAYAILCPPRTVQVNCNNGTSTQTVGDKTVTTYIPALNECK